MTVIAARRYRDGVAVADIDIGGGDYPELAAGEFVWIGLLEPSDEELASVGACFGLHPLAMEDAQHSLLQLPKLEHYGDQLFLVLRTAILEERKIVYGQTFVFLGDHFIITVRHGASRAYGKLRAQLESSPKALTQGPDYVLHSIMDFIVDGYLPVVETLEEMALAREALAGDNFLDRDEIRQIFEMRREVIRFQRVLGVMSDVAAQPVNHPLPTIAPDMVPYFRDVLDHVSRAEYRVAGLREVLTSVAETSSLLEQQRQGDITRKLAAWAAILAVPTAVAGIYGMNFRVMPELDWKYGFYISLGFMGSVCALLYWRFRRLGWL